MRGDRRTGVRFASPRDLPQSLFLAFITLSIGLAACAAGQVGEGGGRIGFAVSAESASPESESPEPSASITVSPPGSASPTPTAEDVETAANPAPATNRPVVVPSQPRQPTPAPAAPPPAAPPPAAPPPVTPPPVTPAPVAPPPPPPALVAGNDSYALSYSAHFGTVGGGQWGYVDLHVFNNDGGGGGTGWYYAGPSVINATHGDIYYGDHTGNASYQCDAGGYCLVYVAHHGPSFSDSFTYTIANDIGQTATATVSISVGP